VELTGRGVLRAPIDPVRVDPGRTVRVTARGLSLRDLAADTAWGRLTGMHTPASRWRIEGPSNFSHAAPIYPLPGPPETVSP
jgi:hypothetical protein